MFPYDTQLATAVQSPPQAISGVLNIMQTIDTTCAAADGLKWFNWLYLQVTQAVENKVNAGGFSDPAWLATLDVQFASLYFSSLYGYLTDGQCPACWSTMYRVRDQAKVARIQFALAGMNAHINHDLPMAIVATCKATNTVPQHSTPQYNDYTSVNATLDSLIDTAKGTLNVRLPGDPLPAVSHVEDMVAAWNLATFRERAWDTAQGLWGESAGAAGLQIGLIDTWVAELNRVLLVPVP
jgi:hypothetical protein